MTQGIAALPGAQPPQNPGQATPFQALPAAQPKTPGIAQTPALSQQSTDALLAMYRNPKLLEGTPYSLYGVIGALSQQLKAEAAAEAAKNNAAMAAYGQQIQQPPVAEGLAQQAAMLARPTQMARHGGIMHGYSGGGAVAFEDGGRVQKFQSGSGRQGLTTGFAPVYQEMRAVGIDISPYDSEPVRADKIRRFEEYKRTGTVPPPTVQRDTVPAGPIRALYDWISSGRPSMDRPLIDVLTESKPAQKEAEEKPPAVTPDVERERAGIESRYPAQLPPGFGVPPSSAAPPSPPRKEKAEAKTGTGVASLPTPTQATPAELSPELKAIFEARKTELEKRLARPESLIKAEEGLAALAKAGIEGQRGDVEAARKEAAETLEAARRRREASPLEDVAFLGQMLEGMRGSKRFGEALAGAAGGAGRATTAREAAMREAEKEFRASQREVRSMQANLRQTELLEGQRQVALEKGKLDEVNAINDQLSNLAQKREEFRIARGDVAFEQAIKGRQVDIQERTLLEKARQSRLMAEQQGDSKLAMAISAAQARVQQSRNNIGSVIENAVGKAQAAMYNFDPEKFAKDQPALFGKIQTAVKDYQANVIKPADDQLNSLINQSISRVGGGQKVYDFNKIP